MVTQGQAHQQAAYISPNHPKLSHVTSLLNSAGAVLALCPLKIKDSSIFLVSSEEQE
jgi:hypothetical protein